MGGTDPFPGDLLADLAVAGEDAAPEAGAAEWTLPLGAPVVQGRRHARLGQQRRQRQLLRRPASATQTDIAPGWHPAQPPHSSVTCYAHFYLSNSSSRIRCRAIIAGIHRRLSGKSFLDRYCFWVRNSTK